MVTLVILSSSGFISGSIASHTLRRLTIFFSTGEGGKGGQRKRNMLGMACRHSRKGACIAYMTATDPFLLEDPFPRDTGHRFQAISGPCVW
jgi:hypothetical protein